MLRRAGSPVTAGVAIPSRRPASRRLVSVTGSRASTRIPGPPFGGRSTSPTDLDHARRKHVGRLEQVVSGQRALHLARRGAPGQDPLTQVAPVEALAHQARNDGTREDDQLPHEPTMPGDAPLSTRRIAPPTR